MVRNTIKSPRFSARVQRLFGTNTRNTPSSSSASLGQNLVRQHVHGLHGLGGGNEVSGTGLSGDSLQAHLLRTLLALDGVVLLHTVQMLQSALGGEDVVHLDVDSLLDDAVSDLLVHLHTHSSLGHIEHHTSASMVTLEGHTLVDGTVGDDIDVVTILVASHVGGERNHSVLAEVSLEHVTSAGTITVSVRHCLHTH